MFWNNNKGQASTGWAVIFVMIILVPIAIIFIIFNHVMTEYLVPESNTLVLANSNLNSTQQAAMIVDMAKYDGMWYFLPIAVILFLFIWLIINATKHRPLEY
jgi:uncharacterized integral membrane protein